MRPVLFCIRHGETDWNREQRFQGREEVELNANGKEQARRNGRRLEQLLLQEPAHLFHFVSSPQSRARQTMEIVRGELGLDAGSYDTDARLVEVDFGDWQGLTEAETRSRDPELHEERSRDKWNFVPPGGKSESYAMQSRRVGDWLAEIDRSTVVVSHGGVLRCLLVLAAGWPPERAAQEIMPQDRILRIENGRIEWH